MNTNLLDRRTATPDVVDDLTRREFITGLTAAGLLAACGNGAGTDAGSPAATTRSIDNDFGSTEIPVDPQRIAVLDVRAVEHLVALAVTPEAVFVDPADYIADSLEGVQVLQTEQGINLELLARSRPDVIIAWENFIEDIVDEVQAIAPTVGINHESFTEWKDPFRFTADVVGRTPQAEQIIADYDARVEGIRERLAATNLAELEVSVVRSAGRVFRLAAGNGSFSAGVLDATGLNRTEVQEQSTDFGEIDLSLEQIPQADADIIFVMRRSIEDADVDAILNDAVANPLWQTLRAVRAGRVYEVALDPWLQGGPIAANIILDDIEAALLDSQ